jgi:hypothetical protein
LGIEMQERLPENEAIKIVEDWLKAVEPEHPDYTIVEDGDLSWAFWISPHDSTSYLHSDGRVEWCGSCWDQHGYDSETGNWDEI